MNVTRTVTLGVVGGALAVWLAAAATSNVRRPAPVVAPKAGVLDVSGSELAGEIARLRDRLRPTIEPTQTRDLFRYAARPSGRVPAIAPPEAVPANPASERSPSPFKLVGMAEDVGDAGAVRTAILSGSGELFLVKEGDAVTSRYRVASIGPDMVELTDLTDNTTLRLALK
jgi:hypothetical protein